MKVKPSIQVLFLDFDGVLNNNFFFIMRPHSSHIKKDLDFAISQLDLGNMLVLKYILTELPNLKIVLSTSWRNHFSIEIFEQIFDHFGIDKHRLIGETPICGLHSDRYREIKSWLRDEKKSYIKSWMAIDDHYIFFEDNEESLNEYHIDSYSGLTYRDAIKIIQHFNSDWKETKINL